MVAETVGVAANAGVQHAASRADHVHAMPAEGNGALIQCDTTAAGPGVAAGMSRSDHIHQIAAPVAPGETGELNAVGAAVTFARNDHVHSEHSHEVRFVMTTNVAALATFVVTQDGVVGVEGDLVLLAQQTVAAESGVYVLGAVVGTAPLTRVAWLPDDAIVQGGYTVHVSEGTLFANTNWFIADAGAITINTVGHDWYPECVTQTVVLVAGTVTVATVPVLDLVRTGIVLTRQIANTSAATDGGYHATNGGATGLTAGE
ncbi:unnamed protein product, partial [marine sediment metagenome]